MRRPIRPIVSLSVLLTLVFGAASAATALSPGDISAERAAVYDPLADEFLYEQAGTPAEAAMGSTAKIMTMYVALNSVANGDVSMVDKITISAKAATQGCNCFNDVDGTLQGGDQMSLRDALHAVALSDGEPTVAVAEFVAKAVIDGVKTPNETWDEAAYWETEFVGLMNEAVVSMGLDSTHFETPHGGDSEGQYTTAADLARIWNVGVEVHTDFLEILGWWQRDLLVYHGGGVLATAYPLSLWHGYYPGVEGSKGGGSTECQLCWIASAQRLGRRVIVSNMQSDDAMGDAATQFAAGFEQIFEPHTVASVGNAGAITDHALACRGSDVVSAARDAGGKLLLQRYTANADAATLVKVGGLATGIVAKSVDVDRVNANYVTTVEQQAGGGTDRVYLRSWRWIGANPTLVDTELVGRGTLAHVEQLTDDRVLTVYRSDTGYRLNPWRAELDGTLTALHLLDVVGMPAELDVAADMVGLEAFVVVRDAKGNLVGRTYAIAVANGVISLVDEDVRGNATSVRVAYVGTGWFGELVHQDEAFGHRWATSYVRSDGRHGLAFWHSAAGVLNHVGTWGDVGGNATETAVTGIRSTGAVSAYRSADDKGLHLEVADYPWEQPGDETWGYYEVARTGPAAGIATEVELCAVTAAGSAGAQVAGVRTKTGKLSLSLWREGDEP